MMETSGIESESSPAGANGPRKQAVLVTGGTGFVGSWAVVELLRRGYRVRTTIRNLARESDVRSMISTQTDPASLAFTQANLLEDRGWDESMAGVDFVLHVASPMPVGEYRGQDVITPAREGTSRVMRAARAAAVKRVVITSSTAAAMPADRSGAVVADETIWTDLPDKEIYNYARSKTLAEQDAWRFIEANNGIELATVLPAQIQGPVLGTDYSPSVEVVAMMLKGKMPAVPRIGFGIVDVRDLVDLHIRAMTVPEAAGQRFIASSDFLWFKDIAQILRDNLAELAAKVSTRTLPDFIVRIGALVNAELKQLAPNLGVRQTASSAKAERILDWKPRPAACAIVDTAHSLISGNFV
jgi:dihydroflavonol-4-reductase